MAEETITERIERMESRLKDIEDMNPIYKASLDQLESLRQIEELLKDTNRDIRLVNHQTGKWLGWWSDTGVWVVYSTGVRQRTLLVLETDNLQDALRALTESDK